MTTEATEPTLGQRLDAFKIPGNRTTDDWTLDCGCSWDSGPYDCPCNRHCGELLIQDALEELHAAADGVLKGTTTFAALEAVLADVGRILTEDVGLPVGPPD